MEPIKIENQNALTGLERCPRCYKLPEITFEDMGFDKINVIFSCPEHGHQAIGQTVQMAHTNWNLYVKLYVLHFPTQAA